MKKKMMVIAAAGALATAAVGYGLMARPSEIAPPADLPSPPAPVAAASGPVARATEPAPQVPADVAPSPVASAILVGTSVGGSADSFALIKKNEGGQEGIFRLGSQVYDLGTLVSIKKGRVTVKTDAGPLTLVVAGSSPETRRSAAMASATPLPPAAEAAPSPGSTPAPQGDSDGSTQGENAIAFERKVAVRADGSVVDSGPGQGGAVASHKYAAGGEKATTASRSYAGPGGFAARTEP